MARPLRVIDDQVLIGTETVSFVERMVDAVVRAVHQFGEPCVYRESDYKRARSMSGLRLRVILDQTYEYESVNGCKLTSMEATPQLVARDYAMGLITLSSSNSTPIG